jgi:hypothetical protein
MDTEKEMGSEAALTAPKPAIVMPLEKPTRSECLKSGAGARASLRDAINAMCRSCIYDPGSGNGGWREQVMACSSSNCPLHAVRPLPVLSTKTRSEAPQPLSAVVAAPTVSSALSSEKVGSNDQLTDERRAA